MPFPVKMKRQTPEEYRSTLEDTLVRFDSDTQSIIDKVPYRNRLSYARSLLGEATKTQAIKMKCYECNGWENAPRRARECRIMHCPLFPYRPK